MAVFGDSTALSLAFSLLYDLESTGRARASKFYTQLGCGILREGVARFRRRVVKRPDHCGVREENWGEPIAKGRPDIAVVLVGPWEVIDRMLPGDTRWRHLGDPVLDAHMREELLAAVDLLSSDGALVVWLTSPVMEVRDLRTGNPPKPAFVESDPARMARFNELVLELPELRPGRVRVVDLAARVQALPGGPLDPDYRPDGIHWDAQGALRLSRAWLGDEILSVYRDQAARASSASRENPHPTRQAN
jgi:hypothetical protein